jgi:oxazoline/thiazoline synthase
MTASEASPDSTALGKARSEQASATLNSEVPAIISGLGGAVGTFDGRLIALAAPNLGFLTNVHVAEHPLAALSFANALVSSPPAAPGSGLGELPPMPVSGWATTTEKALLRLTMEAVERSSSVYVGSEAFTSVRAGDSDLYRALSLRSSTQAVGCGSRVLFGDTVCATAPLAPDDRIQCVEARSLRTTARTPIPAAFVLLGYSAPGEKGYAIADSTGCAAGATLEDAMVRGLLEAIERDALGIWWYNRARRPELTFDADDRLLAIQEAFRMEKRSLTLLDLTTDVEIPVVAAYSADQNGGRIYVGCAADFHERDAAFRAASEMMQFWFWGMAYGKEPANREEWLDRETTCSQPWLVPRARRPLSDSLTPSAEQAVSYLVERITACGCEPYYVDLTRPWFGIPVVRAIVPGMRSAAPNFAPGRLCEVPVKLGWIDKANPDLMQYVCPI